MVDILKALEEIKGLITALIEEMMKMIIPAPYIIPSEDPHKPPHSIHVDNQIWDHRVGYLEMGEPMTEMYGAVVFDTSGKEPYPDSHGGEHCLTCKHFVPVPFIDHKAFCDLKGRVLAGRCDQYELGKEPKTK